MTRVRVLISLALVACLAGCQPTQDERVEGAERLIQDYLVAAAGGHPMRGWLLLDHEIRQRMYGNNAVIYLEGLRASDWTNFDWDIDHVQTDDWFAFVRIRLTRGQFPAFLDARRAGFTIGPGEGPTRSLSVKFGPFGQRSIFASGG